MTDATPAQIAALKLAIDAGDGEGVRLPAEPDTDGALAAGWLARDGDRLHVTESGWHVLKRWDGVEDGSG